MNLNNPRDRAEYLETCIWNLRKALKEAQTNWLPKFGSSQIRAIVGNIQKTAAADNLDLAAELDFFESLFKLNLPVFNDVLTSMERKLASTKLPPFAAVITHTPAKEPDGKN